MTKCRSVILPAARHLSLTRHTESSRITYYYWVDETFEVPRDKDRGGGGGGATWLRESLNGEAVLSFTLHRWKLLIPPSRGRLSQQSNIIPLTSLPTLTS
jgi:hypothetical protein